MQTRKRLLQIHVLFVYWNTQNFSGKSNFLPFEKCITITECIVIFRRRGKCSCVCFFLYRVYYNIINST